MTSENEAEGIARHFRTVQGVIRQRPTGDGGAFIYQLETLDQRATGR